MRACRVLMFFVLALAASPSQVAAEVPFPQNGSTLTYAVFDSAATSQGNITVASVDSYSFQQIGNQWNVTETIKGKITCTPNTAQLSVRFRTTSDIMGTNSIVSNDPNINIMVSYVVQDRVVESTSIGSNTPAGYSAECTLAGSAIASLSQATPALYTSGFRYYVIFYIQASGLGVGSSVPVAIMTSTISGTQNVLVLNTSRFALVGTLAGMISGVLYWDRASGILLVEESTSGTQSERISLTQSTVPIPEFEFPQIATIVAISILFALAKRYRKSSHR